MSVLVLLSVIGCGAGDCAPTPTVNGCRFAGVTTICGVVEAYHVTGMLIGLFTAAVPVAGLVAVIVIVPVQVAAVFRVPTFMDTVRVSFVVPINELLVLAASNQGKPHVGAVFRVPTFMDTVRVSCVVPINELLVLAASNQGKPHVGAVFRVPTFMDTVRVS